MKKDKLKIKKEKLNENKRRLDYNQKKLLRKKLISIIVVIGLLLSVLAVWIRVASAATTTIKPSVATITVDNSELNAVTNYTIGISDAFRNIKYFEYSHNYPIFANYVPVIPGFFITKLSDKTIKVIPAVIGRAYSLTLINIQNPAFEMPDTSCINRIGGLFYVTYEDNSQDYCLTNTIKTTAPVLKITEDAPIDSYAEKPLQLNFTLDAGNNVQLSEIAIKLTGAQPLAFSKSSFCTINGVTVTSFFHASNYFYIEVPSYLRSPFKVILDKNMGICLLPKTITLGVEYSCTPLNSGFSMNLGSPVIRSYTLPHYLAILPPVIIAPKNAEVLAYTGAPTLVKWNAEPNASQYLVSLTAKDKNSGKITLTTTTTSDNFLALTLQEDLQYTITVSAGNIIGAITAPSTPVTFFMLPKNIELLSPEDGTFISTSQNTVVFSLTGTKAQASYQLELGQTKNFSNSTNKLFKGTLSTPSFTLNLPATTFKPGYTYYWRAKEILSYNYEMPWTETRSFVFGTFLVPTFNDKLTKGGSVSKQNPFIVNYTNPDPSKTLLISFYNKTKNRFLVSFSLTKRNSSNTSSLALPKDLFNYLDVFTARLEFKDKTFSSRFDEMNFTLAPDASTLIIKNSAIKTKYNKTNKSLLLTWAVIPARIKTYKIHLYVKDSKGNFLEKKINDAVLNYTTFSLGQYKGGTKIYFKIQAIPAYSPPVILDNLPYFSFTIPKI